MKKSLSSETAKLKDNKLIAQCYVTEVFPSLQKEDVKTMTQLKRAMYLAGDSHSNHDSEELKRVIAL